MQSDYSKGHDLKSLRFLLNFPALIYLRITVTLLLSPYGDCPLNVTAPLMLLAPLLRCITAGTQPALIVRTGTAYQNREAKKT
jgi:hypothetical protein